MVAAVSAGTLMIASIYCSAIYTFGGNLGMAATLAGVSTAGVATYAYFSLKDD